MLALTGVTLMFTIMYLLIKEKVAPPIAFIVLPIVAAFAAGFDVQAISSFGAKGISAVTNNTVLLLFSIAYFSMMSDIGLFDPIVKLAMKKTGKSVGAVLSAIGLTTLVATLDGAGATTYLVVIPPFLPIIKKLNIRNEAILGVMASVTFMNLTPWGGPSLLAATALNVELTDLYSQAIKGIIVLAALAPIIIYAIYRYEVSNGAQASSEETVAITVATEETPKISKNKYICNVILTVLLVTALFLKIKPPFIFFMIALAVGLMINYPDAKTQRAKIKELGSEAVGMTITLFSVGIFIGIINNSGMVNAMAKSIISLLPEILAPHIHWIIAFFGVPLLMLLGSESFYLGLMPIVVGMAAQFGVPAVEVGSAFLVAASYGPVISPCIAATYVGVGVAESSIGANIRYNLKFLWGASVIALVISTLLGVVRF